MSTKKISKKVFVALSGGVDSSVAAALLQRAGFSVIGCHIKGYNLDGCGARDAGDARRVAEKLKIPFYVFDLEKEYKEKVVNYLIDGYKNGITPNPDILCNSEIKFGLFLEKALKMGADFIATGHYVKIMEKKGWQRFFAEGNSRRRAGLVRSLTNRSAARRGRRLAFAAGAKEQPVPEAETADRTFFSLQIANDKNKDQSYFLWQLSQEQLKHCLFPLGDYTKPQVRALAEKFNLPTAAKKDSQGICFLGKITLADFLKKFIPIKKGAVLNSAGQKIGEHYGVYFYTIGQRHIGIKNLESGIKGRNIKPHYIVNKDIKKNTLTIAEGADHPALYKSEIKLTDVNLFASVIPIRPLAEKDLISDYKEISVLARIRYRQPLQPAILVPERSRRASLIFNYPQKSIAPGQSAVFYNKQGELLGGGIIAT